ncbi:MAG: esterase [Deltaproteobacteria bacterium]|nr:esterase [Deltaproteobacteria bacterium]
MSARHVLLDSPALGRRVHLWCHGHMGLPLIVFPSNAGIAHEWQHAGMIDALGPLLAAGRVKIYCTESNVSRTFSGEGPLSDRMRQHAAYEHYVLETLVPFIRADCRLPDAPMVATGCSMGALYSALFALKHPETFRRAVCLSGRYRASTFGRGESSDALYFNDPLAFVPNLSGVALARVRLQTHLTLVVGRGAHEDGCIPETLEMAGALHHRGIPHHLAVWGKDSSHDYVWWKRQARHYLGQVF